MRDTKWTPGPWTATETQFEWSIDAGEVEIGVTEGYLDVGEANARLIAAAPDLYDALARCVSLLEDIGAADVAQGALVQAATALAKARGEP